MNPRPRVAVWTFPFVVFLVAAVSGVHVEAQQFKAAVNGIVADEQGGALPGAIVTIVNVETNVAVESPTDSKGVYTLEDLNPGRYRLSAMLQGFKRFVRDG